MVIIKVFIPLLFVTSVCADVMNLNEFMPTRLEDSKVIKIQTKEFQVSSDFQKQDTDEMIFRENFRISPSEDLQLEVLANQISGGKEKGSGEIQVGGQYDIVPQLGISPMIVLPTGKGSDGVDTHLRFNQTSTILGTPNSPQLQFHVNFDWAHNSQRKNGERHDHNLYVMGFSYQFNDSGSFIIDVLREELEEQGKEANVLEFGTQYDLGSEYLIGIGGGLGFGDESPHWNAILSLVKMVPL